MWSDNPHPQGNTYERTLVPVMPWRNMAVYLSIPMVAKSQRSQVICL